MSSILTQCQRFRVRPRAPWSKAKRRASSSGLQSSAQCRARLEEGRRRRTVKKDLAPGGFDDPVPSWSEAHQSASVTSLSLSGSEPGPRERDEDDDGPSWAQSRGIKHGQTDLGRGRAASPQEGEQLSVMRVLRLRRQLLDGGTRRGRDVVDELRYKSLSISS